MKKTLLLLFTLLFVGGANVYATRKYADLSKLSDGPTSTWNGADNANTMTWTGTSNNMISNFDFAAGDYRDYTQMVVTYSNLVNADAIRVQVKANGQEKAVVLTGEGTHRISLITDFGFTAQDLKSFEWARLLGNNYYDSHQDTWSTTPASAKIDEVYLIKNPLIFDENGEVQVDLNELSVSGSYTYTVNSDGTATLARATDATTDATLSINLPSEGVDLSSLTSFEVTFTGDNLFNCFKLGIANQTMDFYNTPHSRGDVGQYMTVGYVGDPRHITRWEWTSGTGKNGTMTISSIKIKVRTIRAATTETALNTLPWIKISSGQPETPNWNMNTPTDTYYGNFSGDPTHYVDLTSYETLRVYRATNAAFRAFFIKSDGKGTNTYGSNDASWNAEGKYWELDLSKIEKYNGMVALKSIKSGSSGITDEVSNIVAYKELMAGFSYILSGSGVFAPSVDAALADADATIIDATGVTGTGLTLTSANPNCIFIANAGTLANTQNVCVDGKIASLVLQDGHPFACPENVTATVAQYSRTQPNKFGTLCLPFDVADTDVEYYTTNGVNGAGALMLTKLTEEVPAGTPVIVYNPNHGDSHDYMLNMNKDGGSELAVAGATNGTMKLVGAFKDESIDVTKDASNTYYGIQSNEFVQATKTLNVKAFRAYLTSATSATPTSAKLRLQFGNEEATAIQTLAGEGNAVEAIYNANGVQQNGLQKSLNIVKMQNGKTVKVIVK